MAGSAGGETTAEPNLTPLLDVVFQLITFFMLVINFSNENYDQRVRLPVAGSARPVEGSPDEDKLVLNIDELGNLLLNGQVFDPDRAVKEIKNQAQLKRLNFEARGQKLKAGEGLPTIVILRAHREVPFAQLYKYITACQANNFRRFALKAMTGA